MLRWKGSNILKDRIRHENIENKLGLAPIRDKMRVSPKMAW